MWASACLEQQAGGTAAAPTCTSPHARVPLLSTILHPLVLTLSLPACRLEVLQSADLGQLKVKVVLVQVRRLA